MQLGSFFAGWEQPETRPFLHRPIIVRWASRRIQTSPSCRYRQYMNKHGPINQPLTVSEKDAMVFGIQSCTGNSIQMTNSVKASLLSWKPVFRAEFFSV